MLDEREKNKIFKIEMRRNMIEAASALCRMERKKFQFISSPLKLVRCESW